MTRHLERPFCILCLLVCAAPAPAQDPAPPNRTYGFAVGAFASTFIGGNSASTDPSLPRTEYSDTFGTGAGLRLEAFRNFSSEARGQIGLVYTKWPGQSFAGGAFPAGATYGDFSLLGPYLGGRATFGSWSEYVPYVVINLGAVYLSSMNVQSGGVTMPYWTGRWREYAEVGIGIARKTGSGTLTFDVRLQDFGKPSSNNPSITGSSTGISLLLGVGYEWEH